MDLSWITDREFIVWVIFIQTCILILAIYVLLQYGFNIRIFHINVNSTAEIPKTVFSYVIEVV